MNYGRVRALKAWDGTEVKEAPPSTPAKILGLKEAPSVGDILEVPENPKALEKLKAQPNQKSGVAELTVKRTVKSTDEDRDRDGEKPSLNLIIKADVLGSLEAVLGMIEKINTTHVDVKVVAKGLGNVTDADVLRAEATGAEIFAFSVRATATAEILARDKGVTFKHYEVIYRLFEDVEEQVKQLVPSETVYTELGTMRVLAVFSKTDKGMIVGGQVLKGTIELGATARVTRDDQIIAEGVIDTLQCGKMNVKEAQQGEECGIGFKGKAKIEEGDILEVYREEERARV